MDKETRRMIRQMLVVSGSKRASFTTVEPDGSYTETWAHPDGSVIALAWGGASEPDESPRLDDTEEIDLRTFLLERAKGTLLPSEAIDGVVAGAGELGSARHTRLMWTTLIGASRG